MSEALDIREQILQNLMKLDDNKLKIIATETQVAVLEKEKQAAVEEVKRKEEELTGYRTMEGTTWKTDKEFYYSKIIDIAEQSDLPIDEACEECFKSFQADCDLGKLEKKYKLEKRRVHMLTDYPEAARLSLGEQYICCVTSKAAKRDNFNQAFVNWFRDYYTAVLNAAIKRRFVNV